MVGHRTASGLAAIVSVLGSVGSAHAQQTAAPSTPPQVVPSQAAPAPYPYPYAPPPLRLTLHGSRPDLRYRIEPRDADWDEFEDGRHWERTCSGDCQLVLAPGRYELRVDPPAGSGLRVVRRNVELQRDTNVHVEPGNRLQRGFGLGLTIGGGSVLGLGLAVAALTGFSSRETEDKILLGAFIGVGALATAGGITLLVIGRNRVKIDPPPMRAASSRPFMLSLESEL
jgi:hypothetical protein